MTGFSIGTPSFDSEPHSNRSQGAPDALTPWLEEHWMRVLAVSAAIAVVVVLLALLVNWISSRARFMLLDGVVHNRGAILMPWREFRREGNSLFRFRILLGLISIPVIALIIGVFVLIKQLAWRSGEISLRLIVVMMLGSFLVAAWILVMQLISILLMDFVVPVMFLHRLPVLAAARRVIKPLLQEHPASLALYLLARFLLNGVLATLSILIIFLTFFIGLLPYIGSVLLLPLTVFQLIYPLAFLEQLGPQWRILPPERHDAAPL